MGILNVFGGYGFVGSEFCETTKQGWIKNSRDNYEVRSADCVYFISTTHNYNILVDSFVDVDTNLVVLLKVLDNYRDYIKKTGQKGCFNFISSWFVYGKDSGFGQHSVGIMESEPCEPKGFYSITKRCAEQLLVSYCETFNLNYRILRLANVLGPGDKKASSQKNALQYLIGEMKQGRPIQLYDGGNFYRDYIDVRDCARAIDLVVKSGEKNSIYNIGNGVPVCFKDAITYVHAKTGDKSEITNIPQKDFHKTVQTSRSFFMDNFKLRSLGYAPKYTILDTLDSIIAD
jgi:nucleoside-diphosphate-sugar epimerase